jgi:hypothetical protein
VQIKDLTEHFTGLLAAMVAAFFVNGATFCVVFLSSIGSLHLLKDVTFVDIVNLSLLSALLPVVLIFALLPLVAVLEHALLFFCRAVSPALFFWIHVAIIFILIGYFLYESSGFQVLLSSRGIIGLPFMLGFGFSMMIAPFLLKDGVWSAYLVGLPPLMLGIISISAMIHGLTVEECKRPLTATYTTGASQQPTRLKGCVILFLERRLLLYDKKARAAIFIPWPQLKRLDDPPQARR